MYFVKENVVLSPDARSSEKFMHGIKVLIAKNYIDNLSEETRKRMQEKARQGYWPSYAPLGYLKVDGPDGKRTIEPDPHTCASHRAPFRAVRDRKPLTEATRPLARADGLRYRKSGDLVPTFTVHKILRNRIYTGDFDFDCVTYHSQGKYQGIIPRELWARALVKPGHRTLRRLSFLTARSRSDAPDILIYMETTIVESGERR